jgi:hypothetical protein
MNSIGTRRTVMLDRVTIAAAMRLIASMGSSLGAYSTSQLMSVLPVTRSVVVPMPSMPTPSLTRKKQRSCTM